MTAAECVACEGVCEFQDEDYIYCHYNCGKILDDMDHDTTCARCE